MICLICELAIYDAEFRPMSCINAIVDRVRGGSKRFSINCGCWCPNLVCGACLKHVRITALFPRHMSAKAQTIEVFISSCLSGLRTQLDARESSVTALETCILHVEPSTDADPPSYCSPHCCTGGGTLGEGNKEEVCVPRHVCSVYPLMSLW